jgi:DNA invertase Pin-like site-specific DNA recombinase
VIVVSWSEKQSERFNSRTNETNGRNSIHSCVPMYVDIYDVIRTDNIIDIYIEQPLDLYTNSSNVRYISLCSGGDVMATGKFISYLRVSTDKQGRSGLGVEAQRAAVDGYLNGGRWTLAAEYVETESGKRADRPKLAKALAHAKAIGATVVFAKLDRLARNVDLLRSLIASNVDLVFCDLPHVPPGATGRFMLTIMASVAELEAGLISERTKAALAAAKVRGVKLGNPNGARALRGKQVGNKQAVAAVKANAAQRASNLRAILDDLRSQGIASVRAIAAELNARCILTPRGGAWHPTSTARLLARLSA